MGSIYMFTNQVTNEGYVGSCRVNVKTRYNAHIRGDGNQSLKEAIDEYGIETFTFEVLHDGVLDEFLADYEEAAIAKYDTFNNGYNKTPHGRCGAYGENHHYYGKSRDEETKHRISESAKSSPLVAEAQRRATEAAAEKNLGKKRPAEVCEKMSISNRNSDYSEMHDYFLSLPADMHLSMKRHLIRQKFPNVNSGTLYDRVSKWTGNIKTGHDNETLKTIRSESMKEAKNHFYGKAHSAEAKQKISNAGRGREISDSTREKKRNSMMGKNKHPQHQQVHCFFVSLPISMTLTEKHKTLFDEFPNVSESTIYSWTRKWQSELT